MDRASLLFVHGWATDNWVWDGICDEITKGRTFYNIDLPGHGGQEKWDEPTLSPALREIEKRTSGAASGSIIGIGWSLGAEALIASIAESPERFKALVLVSGTPSFIAKNDFPYGQPGALVKRMMLDMKKSPEETLKRFYALNFTEEEMKSREATEFTLRYKYPGPLVCGLKEGRAPGCFPAFNYEGITMALTALYRTDLREKLRGLVLPALVIHGALDAITPV
ncbi:MAG: alpha/beta fold hydrolase, partial [Deltaproteobacteria bacterium]|nr:alpha/beta fold hydrolase [Deltaproteobacteria bacterium]